MPIRALLMDIDDTLFDFQTSSRNALSIAFRAFGLPFTPEMWERYRALDAELWQRFERGEITKEALYVERFRVFFAEYGLEADPAAFNAAYFRELGDQCNFMPHCEQALRQLHAQYKIFIVTNGNTEIQMRRSILTACSSPSRWAARSLTSCFMTRFSPRSARTTARSPS